MSTFPVFTGWRKDNLKFLFPCEVEKKWFEPLSMFSVEWSEEFSLLYFFIRPNFIYKANFHFSKSNKAFFRSHKYCQKKASLFFSPNPV